MTDQIDPSLEHVVRETRAFLDARPAPDLAAAVMRQLEAVTPPETPRRAGVAGWIMRSLWMPRQVSIRPAYGVAGMGIALVVLLSTWPSGPGARITAMPAVDANANLLVQFRLETDAVNVQLAGTFTGWEPAYQLHQIAPGVWTITVALPQGVHDYAFVVDGRQWVADPYAPPISDGFGGTNSRLTVLLPDTARL